MSVNTDPEYFANLNNITIRNGSVSTDSFNNNIYTYIPNGQTITDGSNNHYKFSIDYSVKGVAMVKGDRVKIAPGFEGEGRIYTYVGKSRYNVGEVVLKSKRGGHVYMIASAVLPCPYTTEEKIKKYVKKHGLSKKATKELLRVVEGL